MSKHPRHITSNEKSADALKFSQNSPNTLKRTQIGLISDPSERPGLEPSHEEEENQGRAECEGTQRDEGESIRPTRFMRCGGKAGEQNQRVEATKSKRGRQREPMAAGSSIDVSERDRRRESESEEAASGSDGREEEEHDDL